MSALRSPLSPSLRQGVNQQLALIAQGLASEKRLEMLEYLAQTERCVDELSHLAGLTVANTSRHLQVLKQAALVVVRREGKRRFYRLTGDDVVTLVASLRNTAEIHLAEVERLMGSYFTQKDALEAISAAELLERTQQGEVTVLDIRPEKEFAAGHLPHAINIPPEKIAQRISALDNTQTIVAYCRGPYCLYSYDAVKLLLEKGFTAQRLEEGFPEWRAAGYPVQYPKENNVDQI
ncbi:MAG: metalloregulator ArsR/SmtB family transcription factor [Thiotrichaceae bacterium]